MHKHVSRERTVKLEYVSDAHGGDVAAVASRAALYVQRIYARRWLIATVTAILWVLYLAFPLPAAAVIAGAGVMVAAAGFLPRERLLRVTRPKYEVPQVATPGYAIVPAIIEAVPEPAIVLSQSSSVVNFNAKAAEAFEGLRAGRHISSVIRHPHLLEAVERVSGGQPAQTIVYSEHVPFERRVAATVSWIGQDDTAGSDMPAMLIFLRDLTEQERLDEMRADFIANASHELKTPLASLIGFIETLQGPARNDPDARDRFLSVMLTQAGRMSRLIENLLSLSRVEMHAHLRPQTRVDIKEVVQHAVQTLDVLAAESGIEIQQMIPEEPAFVLGDRDELTQVFQNLIHNAIKYGGNGRRVRVRMDRLPASGKTPPRLLIAVEDDGPGIPSYYLPRLTERFYRVPGTEAGGRNGTGLGLAIAKQVVSRHRGEMNIRSEQGKGSVFTVILAEAADETETPQKYI